MKTLEAFLGIDPQSPEVLRAELLADNDRALLRGLVEVRKSRGLRQAEVGRIMGVSQASVSQFEAHDSNPTLATIRRYAHAVGALITHAVAADDGQLLDPAQRAHWAARSLRTPDLIYDPNEVGSALTVTCLISQSPRTGDPTFDPQPGDLLLVTDVDAEDMRARVLRRDGNQVSVQLLLPGSLTAPSSASA